jgi:hypothetical protein
MEKRSRRRIRDLVTQPASQGLSENEIGCARISMMARGKNRPIQGPDTEVQDQYPPSLTSGLQRTAGPYSWVIFDREAAGNPSRRIGFAPKAEVN